MTKVLMSPDNPTGWKLEDLLAQLVVEIEEKNAKIEDDPSDHTQAVYQNNKRIQEHLYRAIGIQQNTLATLAAVGPDRGPTGKPRIGVGSR